MPISHCPLHSATFSLSSSPHPCTSYPLLSYITIYTNPCLRHPLNLFTPILISVFLTHHCSYFPTLSTQPNLSSISIPTSVSLSLHPHTHFTMPINLFALSIPSFTSLLSHLLYLPYTFSLITSHRLIR